MGRKVTGAASTVNPHKSAGGQTCQSCCSTSWVINSAVIPNGNQTLCFNLKQQVILCMKTC